MLTWWGIRRDCKDPGVNDAAAWRHPQSPFARHDRVPPLWWLCQCGSIADQALSAEMERRPQMWLYGLNAKAAAAGESRERLKPEPQAHKGRHWSCGSCEPLSDGQEAEGVAREA